MAQTIQIRVPDGLVEALDRLVEQRTSPLRPLTRSEVIRQLLVAGLQGPEALVTEAVRQAADEDSARMRADHRAAMAAVRARLAE